MGQDRLFATPWTAACQASLPITNSRVYSDSMSIEPVMPSNHLILCRPLLLPPSILRQPLGLGKTTVLGPRGPGTGLEAGARLCLAGQQHLAVVRDLPLQRLHEIRTCKGTTTRPVVRAPGSARAPPGGETGEGACAGRLMPKGPSDSGIPPYPGGAWREAREAPGGAEFKEALTLGVGHILARGQHWLKRQRPSLGAPAGRRDLLTHSCGGSPALVAEGFGLRTSSSYPVFSSSLFS